MEKGENYLENPENKRTKERRELIISLLSECKEKLYRYEDKSKKFEDLDYISLSLGNKKKRI